MDHLVALDERELREREDAVAVGDGWHEKSKLDSVLIVDSRAMRSAAFTRGPSRPVNSSASKASTASSAPISPRSSCWTRMIEHFQCSGHAHGGADGDRLAASRRRLRARSTGSRC